MLLLQEVARYCAKWTAPIRKMSSPVFASVTEEGELVEGLEGVPDPGEGPLIFVGNHHVKLLLSAPQPVVYERLSKELLRQKGREGRDLCTMAHFKYI